MSNPGELLLNLFIQRQALDAAVSGNAIGIVILVVYICLLIASIVGLAAMIERAVRLRRGRLIDPALAESAPKLVADGDISAAVESSAASKTVLGAVLAKELDEYRQGHVPIDEAIEAAGDDAWETLHANLDILATAAKVAPLLGLLGTVLGMMYAFGQLDVGTSKETLAQGITAALDTTVRGLIIAIFCLAFERYYQRRINHVARSFSAIFTRIIRAARRPGREA